MNDLTIPDVGTLSTMATADLLTRLDDSIALTARAIALVAAIWTELEQRGVDLSDRRFALRGYMRDVAGGKLLPEVVATLAGQVRTLNLVATLPVPEQRRLIDGAPIEIVTADGDTTQRTLSDLSWTEAARVIRDGTVRTPDEQRLAMARTTRASRSAPRSRPRRIAIVDDMFCIGPAQVPLERVLSTLRNAGYDIKRNGMSR